MMTDLIQSDSPHARKEHLQAELRAAQQELVEAEAELAEEQAAVNAFRMHSRLMLDDLVDRIYELLSEKQMVLTRLQLLRQAEQEEADREEDPLGPPPEPEPYDPDADPALEHVLMPTPVPKDKAAERRLYRELARRFHPDLAESAAELAYRTSMMAAVNTAYSAGDVHALYDIAGELQPEEIARIESFETVEVQRLYRRIVQCRRRRRKVRRQLQTLRQENTARLWRKAQGLEGADENWWASVRVDLEAARDRLQDDVDGLRAELALLEPDDPNENADQIS